MCGKFFITSQIHKKKKAKQLESATQREYGNKKVVEKYSERPHKECNE